MKTWAKLLNVCNPADKNPKTPHQNLLANLLGKKPSNMTYKML